MATEIQSMPSILPLLVFLVPTFFGVVTLLLGRFNRLLREFWAFLGLLVTFIISVAITLQVLQGYVLTSWHNNFYVDGLSALMEILGCLLGVIAAAYSIKFIRERIGEEAATPARLSIYYGLLLLFLGMMNWTCATNNMVMLYVSLEATTLATAFLVTFYWKRESLEAGYKYLMLVTVGISFGLFGCVLIYSAAAKYPEVVRHKILLLTDLGKIADKIPRSVVLLASAFLVAGFGTKAGLVPFHAWLPDAHAEAPAPISAMLSGIVIKVGAYALARTVTVFAPYYSSIVVFIAILASVSMLAGIVMAWAQDDLKRLLAFHSVSQMGYVIEGLGLGTRLGIYGGLFHLLNHTIFKALLFLSVGAVIYATGGLRRISQLKGVGSKIPLAAFCFFIGALAMGGMPPFNGFMSKFTLFVAVAHARLLWAAVIAIITSLLTLACMVHAAYKVFMGKFAVATVSGNPELRKPPISMWAGMFVLVALCVVLGVYPQFAYPLLNSATRCILKILGGG